MFQACITCTQKYTQHMAHWKSIKPPGYPHVHHSSPRPQPHKEFVSYPYFPHTSQILTQAPGPSHAVTSGHLFLIFNLRIPSPRCAHRWAGGHVCMCAEASRWHGSCYHSRPYSLEAEHLLEPEASIFISAGSQQAPLVSCLPPPQRRQGLQAHERPCLTLVRQVGFRSSRSRSGHCKHGATSPAAESYRFLTRRYPFSILFKYSDAMVMVSKIAATRGNRVSLRLALRV